MSIVHHLKPYADAELADRYARSTVRAPEHEPLPERFDIAMAYLAAEARQLEALIARIARAS